MITDELNHLAELRQLSREKSAAIALENALSDIFDLIKITHQISINSDNEMSPYNGDEIAALRASVSFLREKLGVFETLYYGADEVRI